MKILLPTILAVVLSVCLVLPAWAGEAKSGFTFGTDPKVSAIRPGSPVEIKIKRGKDGTYTWEIKGNDADEILRADQKLREKLKGKPDK